MHATFRGRFRWQVLDERGAPEVPRCPSGFALAGVEGVEQSNLITNFGLDAIGTLNPFLTSATAGADSPRVFMAAGTGSTAPAFTDTALVSEAQRDNTSGSFPVGLCTGELDTVTNVWRATGLVTRLVTMTEARNLTEFGLAETAISSLTVRELLRDGVGDPITVNLLEGKSLRVDHSFIAELPAPAAGTAATIDVDKYDAGDVLESSTPHGIIYGGWASAITSGNIITGNGVYAGAGSGSIFGCWTPSTPAANMGLRAIINAGKTYSRTLDMADPSANYSPQLTNTVASIRYVPEVYVPGTYTNVKRATIPTGSFNEAIYGYTISEANVNTNRGHVVLFDSPASYTKSPTDTVRVGFVSTWARG